MKIKTNIKDVIWNYISIFFSLASQIIWLPALLYFLPSDDLGIWYIFVSIGSIVSLLDFGFTPQISRSAAYSWSGAEDLHKQGVSESTSTSEPNYGLLAAVMRSCRILYFFIAVVAFILMLVGGNVYLSHVIADYTFERQAAWIIYIVSAFMNIYIGWYMVILRGIGDVAACGRSIVMAKIVMLIMGIILLMCDMGLIGLSVTMFVSSLVQRELAHWYLKYRHEITTLILLLRAKKTYSIKYVLSMIWPNAWRDGLVSSSEILTTQATVLLCGSFLSLIDTGIYSVSMQVVNAIINIARGLATSYIPAIQSAFVIRNMKTARQMIERSVASYYIICIGGCIVFVIIGIPILHLFRETFVIDRVVFVLLSVHMLLMDRHKLSAFFISTTNSLPYTKAFIISSISSFLASYILVGYAGLGIYGIILGAFIVQCLYNNWHWNMYLNSWFDTTEISMIKEGTIQNWKSVKSRLSKAR